MSTRRQTVRSYQPTHVERFDEQFWPVFMSLCITSTILAATIVTLMAGFWMWASLMVLPAALAILLLVLRFVDNKRIRRSLQLAMILSLAAHCAFLIFAHSTKVFYGFSLQVVRSTTSVEKQRVIHVSKQVDTLPWMDENPLPTPTPEEPVPEKKSTVDTATVRPQPSQLKSQTPTESPQLVRRQQLSKTVPRLGQNLSKLSRQVENAQPKSSEQVALAEPAPANPKSQTAEPEASATEIARQPAKTSPSKRETPTENRRSQPSESRTARTDSRERPELQPKPVRRERSETSTPRVADSSPARNVQAPRAATTPSSPRSASQPSDVANLERSSRQSPQPTTARIQRSQPAASTSTQLAQPRPTRSTEQPAVARRSSTSRTSRAASGETSASPTNVERPRPANRAVVNQGRSEMNPQPLAMERSSGGTAGVGRTSNFNRDRGARQSSALSSSDSLRRREETTQTQNKNSLALRQMSRVPRSSASQPVPSSAFQPDSIPLASRSATTAPAELSASASASLTQSNADARRSETSVAKGTGSVDLGPTKIVSESMERRVEGGGQPQVQDRPLSRQMAERGEQGASSPSLATEQVSQVARDPGSSESESQVSDEPTPSAIADLNARPDGRTAESGAPIRSQNPRDDFANTTAADMADASLGRASQSSDNDTDEDDEEQRRRGERARQLAQSARRFSGSDSPDIDSPVEQDSGGSQVASRTNQASELSDSSSGLATRSNGRSGGGSMSRDNHAQSVSASSASAAGNAERRSVSADSIPEPGNPGAGTTTRQASASTPNLVDGDTPEVVGRSRTGRGLANQVNDDNNVARLDRDSPPGMALDIDSRVGPAGISNVVDDDPGIDSRRASRDSPAIQSMTETRFRKQEAGGVPSISSAPVIAKEAFRSRNQPSRSSSAPKTEAAIEMGLAYLARQQQEDGSWTLHGVDEGRDGQNASKLFSDSAATGLAILAFQGAGYNHKEFKYASQLQAAINWLVEHQKDTGELYISADDVSNNACRFYSHGIATLALAEAYGMTQDEDIRIAVQLALDYIADTQHKRLGGWRYRRGVESDTSVTGWMMMAMQSGKLAGLETSDESWQGIERWLRYARSESSPHQFRYNPYALDRPETRHGREISPCMTAVGLLMNVYLGWDRADPRLTDGATYLLNHLPDDSTITKRDTYYWYYATQILRHVGGESWEKWHGALHPLLVRTQMKEGEMAGSWDPLNPVPDRWGAQAGRLYVTTMNLLSLEVDYRLLPLHDDTVK